MLFNAAMGFYHNSKGLGVHGHVEKTPSERVMKDADWRAVLNVCHDSQNVNEKWERDHAIIFFGAALGMRRAEIPLFERDNFRDLNDHDVIHAPTLKRSERIKYTCQNCRRKCHVKLSSSGDRHKCSRCGHSGTVPNTKNVVEGAVPIDIDIIEGWTKDYILGYLDKMRPDQQWLFESRPNRHIHEGHVNRIFNTYLIMAGLNNKISFHSLRHARGTRVYTQFHDLKAVQSALRQKDFKSAQWYADNDAERKEEMKDELERDGFNPLDPKSRPREKRRKAS